MASIAFYGPTQQLATKVAVGIIPDEVVEPSMFRWHAKTDMRQDVQIMKAILDVIREQEVCSVVMVDKIIGCPHEEGIDYSIRKSGYSSFVIENIFGVIYVNDREIIMGRYSRRVIE